MATPASRRRARPMAPLESLSIPELVDLAEKVASNPRNPPAAKQRVVDHIFALLHARLVPA